MKFSIANLIPTFILADRNGMALSKAIERGMRLFAQTVEEGLNATIDVERITMSKPGRLRRQSRK